MAAKRGGSIQFDNSPRGSSTGRGDTGVIRNLIGSPDDKASRVGGSGSKTAGGSSGLHFMNVVEQHEEEVESDSGELDLNVDSAEAQRVLTDIKRARSRIEKKAKHLQEVHRQ